MTMDITNNEQTPMGLVPRNVSDIVHQMAKTALGKEDTGDQVAMMLFKALKQCDIKLKTAPLEYYAFLQEAVRTGKYVDTPKPGDVGVLQCGAQESYWSYVVDEVNAHEITVLIAQSFDRNGETIMRRLEVRWPDYNATWHTIGFIRF